MAGRSFVEAVKGVGSPLLADINKKLIFPKHFHEDLNQQIGEDSFLKKAGLKDGLPAILLSDSEIKRLAVEFEFSLVGKFTSRRPMIDVIRNHFLDSKLAGGWSIGLMDGRHIIIKIEREEDYIHLFTMNSMFIDGCRMNFFKWNPDFEFHKESLFAPIWISLPALKFHLYHKEILYSIGAIFGRPLKIDMPTFNQSRPSVARILVELNVTEIFSDEVWLGSEDHGYWQKIVLENCPDYCLHCSLFGHSIDGCFRANPALRLDRKGKTSSDKGTGKNTKPDQTFIPPFEKGESSGCGVFDRHIEIPIVVNHGSLSNVASDTREEGEILEPGNHGIISLYHLMFQILITADRTFFLRQSQPYQIVLLI